MPPEHHGTKHGSDYYGCECVLCASAAKRQRAEHRARRKARLAAERDGSNNS